MRDRAWQDCSSRLEWAEAVVRWNTGIMSQGVSAATTTFRSLDDICPPSSGGCKSRILVPAASASW